MKIGIISHHYVNNFGAFLQAWALRETISKMFPEDSVEIIDYMNIKHFLINSCGWLRYYRGRENIKCWLEKIKLLHTFSKYRKEKMTLSPRCYSIKKINSLQFDCIIIGSDEVWNFADKKANKPVKFGHGLQCKKLIAYAPSVGKATLNTSTPDYVIDGIKSFHAISVRDDLTNDVVYKITNCIPTRVLDPTFLIDFPDEKLPIEDKPYILFYYCEHLPKSIKEQIFDYANKHDLAIYGAGECDKKFTKMTVNITPFQWIHMFKNAKFIFTGTFHGAVFSILSRRQFKVYLTNDSRIQKVNALLKEMEITNRNIHDDFVFDLDKMNNEIDYSEVYAKISKKRAKSIEFLKNAISK